jgi:hypothetical protein
VFDFQDAAEADGKFFVPAFALNPIPAIFHQPCPAEIGLRRIGGASGAP